MGWNSSVEQRSAAFEAFHWQCPVCQSSLLLKGDTWRCDSQHSFDRAKEKYVNLLLAQHKKSKAPGDNKEMVLARQAFLGTQAYAPLAEALSSMAHTHLQHSFSGLSQRHPMVFDVGCSEGYYSAFIQQQMMTEDMHLHVAGIDISKPAIQKAAKNHQQNQYAVASSYNIPLADNIIDVAVQVFAPASNVEMLRILRPAGLWLMVEPATNHLRELKAFVYDNAQLHEPKQDIPEGFRLVEQRNVSFSFSLESEVDRLNLLKMTPYYWRISSHNKARLLTDLSMVTADFTIKQFACDSAVSLFKE